MPRMQAAWAWRAMSASAEGTVVKYWVMFCWVSALKSPPRSAIDGGGLVGGHAGAAAKGHVFLGVGHAGKVRGGLIAADHVIGFDGDHGGEGVADDDDLQAVG